MLQAELNAKEARKWIDEWRASQQSQTETKSQKAEPEAKSQTGPAPPTSSNGSTPQAETKTPEKEETSDKPENAKEARAWIEDWRSRSGS